MQEGIRVDFKSKKRGGREIDQVIEGGWQPNLEGWQGGENKQLHQLGTN